MTKEETNNLIQIFAQRREFESSVLREHQQAKSILIKEGANLEVFEELLAALKSSDENVILNIVQILMEIGNKDAIIPIKNLINVDETLMGRIIWVALYTLGAWPDEFPKTNILVNKTSLFKMTNEELIKIIAKHSSLNLKEANAYIPIEHMYARRLMIEKGNKINNDLIDILKEWFQIDIKKILNAYIEGIEEGQNSQNIKNFTGRKQFEESTRKPFIINYSQATRVENIVFEIVDILGEIGDRQAIPYLKRILEEEHYSMGITAINTAVALIKLGEKVGLDFLIGQIKNTQEHRDIRLGSVRALIMLGLKDIFEKDEKIDFGGKTMLGDWPSKMEKLVARLRKK